MKMVQLDIKQVVQNEIYWIENSNAHYFYSKQHFELEYHEIEFQAKVHIVYKDNQLRLTRRTTESLTTALFILSEKTRLVVDSENGQMRFDVLTLQIDASEDSLSFEYELYQGHNLISHNEFSFIKRKG